MTLSIWPSSPFIGAFVRYGQSIVVQNAMGRAEHHSALGAAFAPEFEKRWNRFVRKRVEPEVGRGP